MKFGDRIVRFYQKTIYNTFCELNHCAEPGSIVFLGDSITDFFRINEFFHRAYVINRGIGGDTTDGVLKRLKESVFDLSPSKVFILIGTNDVADGKSEEYIVSNIEKIIARIQESCPQAKLYLQSIYPISTARHRKIKRFIVGKRTNEKICRINERLKSLAQKKHITYIDVYPHLVDSAGNIRVDYTVEGLHLTIQGYRAVAEVLKPWVME